MRDIKLTVIAIAVITVILAGEVYIYMFNTDDTYHITTSASENGISYSIYSGTSNHYDVVITDNGDYISPSEYYIYYDETRPSNLKEVQQPIGSAKLEQGYYISQLRYQLSNRGVDTEILDANELKERLQNDIAVNVCNKALIVVSGVLPDTVYSGNETDEIMEWIDAGGRLYWVGNTIGSSYSTSEGITEVDSDYQLLFF